MPHHLSPRNTVLLSAERREPSSGFSIAGDACCLRSREVEVHG